MGAVGIMLGSWMGAVSSPIDGSHNPIVAVAISEIFSPCWSCSPLIAYLLLEVMVELGHLPGYLANLYGLVRVPIR